MSTPRSNRRLWPWLVGLFILSWFVSATVTLPWSAVAGYIEPPEGIEIEAAHGDVWGDGELLITWIGEGRRPPISVDLQFHPESLLRFAPEWRVKIQTTGIEASGDVRPTRPAEDGAFLVLPSAEAWIDLESPWLPDQNQGLPVTGRIHLSGTGWRLRPEPLAGEWTAQVAGLALGGLIDMRLGDLSANGRYQDDGSLVGTVQTVDGQNDVPVDLDLAISGKSNKMAIRGYLDPKGDLALLRKLSVIGIGRLVEGDRIEIAQPIQF